MICVGVGVGVGVCVCGRMWMWRSAQKKVYSGFQMASRRIQNLLFTKNIQKTYEYIWICLCAIYSYIHV